jgi:DNA polymerase-1
VDYLALIGDSSDNIPGVAGIGPKWATDLIKQYQTIENIYDHIDQISPSAQEKLIASKASAFKSKELIILMDVPGIESARLEQFVCTPNISERSDILVRQYEFTSMNKHLDQMKKTLQKPVQESLFG